MEDYTRLQASLKRQSVEKLLNYDEIRRDHKFPYVRMCTLYGLVVTIH
jgi:hypothetical protein